MALEPEAEGHADEALPAGVENAAGPLSEEAVRDTRLTPAEAVAGMHMRVPARGNRKLRRLLENVEADKQLKAWWHVANVNAVVRLADQRPLLGAHPDRHQHRRQAPAASSSSTASRRPSSATTG